MQDRKFISQFHHALMLMRWCSPTGAFLLFMPCAWGLACANGKLLHYLLFFVGAWFMRSFGCIINDIADCDIDRLVPRTQKRPLANQDLSLCFAIALAMACLAFGFCVWFQLSWEAQKISILGLLLACLYPFSKRYFIAPQLILGFTFNIGVLVAYAHVCSDLSWSIITLWLSGAMWTIAYDTVYALKDAPFDKQMNLFSTAHYAQRRPKFFISVFMLLHSLLLFGVCSWYWVLFHAFLGQMLVYAWHPQDHESNYAFFKNNVWLAAFLWCLFLIK